MEFIKCLNFLEGKMKSGGKRTDGRAYELWLVATGLLGQLPTDKEEGKSVLLLMVKLFNDFRKKPCAGNIPKTQNEPQKRLQIVRDNLQKREET